jgi:lipoate-protein ligase A
MNTPNTAHWHVIDTGPRDAFTNMAIDEVLLSRMREASSLPVLRFYSWSRPSITVGYFQEAQRDFDLEACRARGWDVVRRLTGGRAVFHDQELTYSVILPRSAPGVGGSVLEGYRLLSRGLLRGLQLLGVNAELASLHGRRRTKSPRERSPNCFDSPSWYEITVHGKKLVGSAQRRMPYGILQQGSILISTERYKEFYEVLRTSTDMQRRNTFRAKEAMTSLSESFQSFPGMDVLKRSLLEGFQEALNIRFFDVRLTPEESMAVDRLVRQRYRSKDWNFLRKSRSLKKSREDNHS